MSNSYGLTNSYSNMDLWSQQARKRAEQWAQTGAQGQQQVQPDSVAFGRAPQAQSDNVAFGNVQQNVSAQQTQVATQPDDGSYKCTDGKDDGKIGWKAPIEVVKGAGKFLAGLVGFEWGADGKYKGWNGGKVIKNVAIAAGIGAVCVLTAGTAVPAIIAGAGVAMAGAGVVKQGYRIATAKTDAEMKAACNDFGSDAMALGMSVVGAKAAMKQYASAKGLDATKYNGIKGTWNSVKDSTTLLFKQGWKGLKAGYNAYKAGGLTAVKDAAVASGKNFGSTVKTNYNNAIESIRPNKTQEAKMKKYDNDIKSLEKKIEKTTDADTRAKLETELKTLKEQRGLAQKQYDDINNETTFEGAQQKINDAERSVADLQKKIDTAKAKSTKGLSKADLKTHNEGIKDLNNQLKAANDKLNLYKEVVDSKTSQARNLRAQIDKLEKEKGLDNITHERRTEIDTKIAELQNKQNALDFKLPEGEHKTYVENATKASENATKAKEAYDQAKAETKTAKVDKTKLNEEMQAYNTAKTRYEQLQANPKAKYVDRFEAFKALKEAETPQVKEALAKEAYDVATSINTNAQALSKATSGYDYIGTGRTAARGILGQFNNQFGTLCKTPFAGKNIPFTNVTVPSTIGKGWAIAATGNVFGITTNNKDEIPFEDVAIAQAVGMDPIQYYQAKKAQMEAQAQVQTPQAYYQQTTPQTGQRPINLADMQLLDTYMKSAYGVA